MGVICVLLGIIMFLGMTGLGALAANNVVEALGKYGQTLEALNSSLPSNAVIIAVVVAVFAILGLLIGLNLVMNGLTYSKVSKLYRMAHRRKAR